MEYEIKISKERIISFIRYIKSNEIVKPLEENKITLTIDEQKKLDKIKNKKRKLLREHGVIDFPDWAKSLTVEEIIEKLNNKV